MVQILPSNTFTTAKWIVSSSANVGTHTTIATALTSASSGDTIFILPGTYTENLTLKAGVNLTAFGSDDSLNQTGKVIISGTATFTGTGSVTISGIQLQTNSAFLLAVTGSAASIVNLQNCNLNCTNNTGITFTSSNAAATINCNDCTGDLGTTGIGLFASSSTGTLNFNQCAFTNGGASLTASTISAGLLYFFGCKIFFATTSSGTSAIVFTGCAIDTAAINTIAITSGGSSVANTIFSSVFATGSASAISVSANTTTVTNTRILSSNTNPISGAGTLQYAGLTFNGGNSAINTTTQTGGTLIGGTFQAPSVGFLGEQIRATVAGTGTTLSTGVVLNLTTISLTAGVWDISCVVEFNGTVTGTNFNASIGTVSGGVGTAGDNYVITPYPPTAGADMLVTIPSYRLILTATTTIYLTVQATFTVGTCKAYGRISATRVG